MFGPPFGAKSTVVKRVSLMMPTKVGDVPIEKLTVSEPIVTCTWLASLVVT